MHWYLRGDYEAITTLDPKEPDESRKIVRKEAPNLVKQILNIKDSEISITAEITKYDTALMLLVFSAVTEPEKSRSTVFANQAIDSGEEALKRIQRVFLYAESGKEQAQSAIDWIQDYDKEDFIHLYLAGAHAVKLKNGDISSANEIVSLIKKISPHYKKTWPPEKMKMFEWFFANTSSS